ncbi:hypothetical protein [Arthrobacter rhizosphaerae]|uniref:hypothetical protein n=1 Tax=Arthrobacter rhizosphaerae TaxID=2855490 RepID=UPI001FF5ADBE|nr:hypothetical protein [Arthrobacter rhizosphaerae]
MLSALLKTETAVSAMSSAGVLRVLQNLPAHLPGRVNCNGSHGAVGEQLVPFAVAPVVEFPQTEPVQATPARHISLEEEAGILSRADELNARVAKILHAYS